MAQASTIQQTEFITGEISLSIIPIHSQNGSICGHQIHHEEEIEEGSQVMAVNCYPACPEPEIALGMPPHSDFSSLTILLQSSTGLQIMDCNKSWVSVPYIEGALIVQLGDQVEVMSNGIYKSVIHRVTVNKDVKRLSFASLHSLPLHKKVSPAPKLVNENNAAAYGEFSFNDFLDYIASNDFTKKRFIDTLKKGDSCG